jgi:hypothetical protein
MGNTSAAPVGGGIRCRGPNTMKTLVLQSSPSLLEDPMQGIRLTDGLSIPVRRAILWIALLAVFAPAAIWAEENGSAAIVNPAMPPKLVLARYLDGIDRNKDGIGSCAVAVDIDASLPKLAKEGRLQAIRHFLPFGRSEYQVVRIEGDRMVRQQLIARYLSAEAQAEAMPISAVGITEANYRIRYMGSVGFGRELTYVFRIKPRKKRVGLIEGELWLDAHTGVAVHQAGRMVKTPSIFLKQVNIVRDVETHNGLPDLRITRLDIGTRLFGRAELTIRERACPPAPGPAITKVATGTVADGLACVGAP